MPVGSEGRDGMYDEGWAVKGGSWGSLGAIREVCLSLTESDLCSLGQFCSSQCCLLKGARGD